MVNIIIPFYNAEATLEQTLASVQEQTYSKWSIIFIDDCSTDSSSAIAKDFIDRNGGKGKIIRTLRPKTGPALGRNLAIKNADGDFIICLDADDLLAPFCLKQRVSVMEKDSALDWAVFNQYQCAPGEKEPFQLFNLPAKTREEAISFFTTLETAWQTMAPIWKIEALRKLGGFDDTLFPSEDPDLHLRALLDPALKVEIKYDLPADCYYFVANKGADKILSFYRESIKSKLRFIKKMVDYLPVKVSEPPLKRYRKNLRKGYFKFIKIFMLSRFEEHSTQFNETTLLLSKANVLSSKDILVIKFLYLIFTSDSVMLNKFRIRGIAYSLLSGLY